MKIKKIITRAGIGLATIGVIIGGAAAFSAFEAHVVNVTATIENALTVPVEQNGLTFGEMFPEEVSHQTLPISLSSSFLATPGVDDIEYMIRQKPKCGVPIVGDVASGTPVSYSSYPQVTENADGTFVCPAGSVQLPLLCPYLSKHEENADGADTTNGIDAFHGLPGPWTEQTAVNTEVTGILAKSTGKTSTNWDIDLHTPCFAGECAQDWTNYVETANPAITDAATAALYQADPRQEHQEFGCDLWVEVTGISTSTTATTGLLTVTKIVNNEGVGTSTVSDFPLFVDGSSVTSGVATTTTVGNHVVTETSNSNYTASFSDDCLGGNVTVSSSTPVDCVLTNTYTGPFPSSTGTLTIIKNTSGGDGTFNFTVSGASSSAPSITTTGDTGTTGAITVGTGTYSVAETVPANWTLVNASCNDGSSTTTANTVSNITVGPSSNVTCTFTDMTSPGTLTIVKNVVNTGGGTATAGQFTINVPAGTPNSVTGNASGTPVTIPGNASYSVTEATSGPANYVATYSAGCSGTMTPGGTPTCTVTNTYQFGMITVNKVMNNIHGGQRTASSFTLLVDGDSSTAVTNGATNDFAAGSYTITEAGATGYTASFTGDCDAGGNLVLTAGANLTCTITNTDIAPVINMVKVVVGSSTPATSFTMTVNGHVVPTGDSISVNSNSPNTINENTSVPAGFHFTSMTGTGTQGSVCPSTLGGTVTLHEGENITCTITNTAN